MTPTKKKEENNKITNKLEKFKTNFAICQKVKCHFYVKVKK